MPIGKVRADDATLWLVLSERGGAYAEANAAFSAAWGSDPKSGLSVDFPPGGRPPALIVTFGSTAFRTMAERQQNEPALSRVPILAALIPRSSYEASLTRSLSTALYLDQPIDRYFELLRQTMPDRKKIGLLLGTEAAPQKAALTRAAQAKGFRLMVGQADADDVYPALRSLLDDVDVLLVLPDNRAINASNFQHVLLTTYRQRIPLISFSAAQVKAGAALALVTSPAQAGHESAALARNLLTVKSLPPPRYAGEFSVVLNPQVTRSLGLGEAEADQITNQLRKKEEAR